MESWLEALIARGRETGSLTYDEVDAAIPDGLSDNEQVALLTRVLDRLESEGISLIDPDEPDAPPDTPPELLAEQAEPEALPVYHRDAAFEQRLRAFGVPFSDAMVSHEPSGAVFDAELIVPGEQALAAWLALRNAVPLTGLWPVIGSELDVAAYGDYWPYQLDPGDRRHEWFERFCLDRNIPMFRLTPDTIRTDAATNVVAAERVPPMPWIFRSQQRNGRPPPAAITEPDAPLPASEPNFVALFANEGSFRCVRQGFGGNDYPFFPFLRVRLYPTAVPWEVFTYAPFGGWNEAPWPDEQLAMLRHWHGLYGVEVVSVRDDWYELFVPRPPRTRHQALRLLDELYWFGEERAFEMRDGDDPVVALAAAHYWHFWWD
jgi:hypothetical protein